MTFSTRLRLLRDSLTRKARNRGFASKEPEKWVAEVGRIFREENVCYRIDSSGGVHFAVDQQFEANRVATLSGLGRPRYQNVARNFEDEHERLSAVPPQGKLAIRSIFAAAEGLFRLMFNNEPRLDATDARKRLGPIIQKAYAGNRPALRSASKLLASFAEWVDAAQFYKHEPGTEEVIEPPLELAVHLVSSGTSHLRWLIA